MVTGGGEFFSGYHLPFDEWKKNLHLACSSLTDRLSESTEQPEQPQNLQCTEKMSVN